MKAIYTTSHGRIFQVKQDPSVPFELFTPRLGVQAKVEQDARGKTVTGSFAISTLDGPHALSNREMANNMIAYIKERKITHIDPIQNRYKIYIEYSSCYDGQSLGHATLTRDILAVDGVIPLGVAVNNENVFRRAKSFKTKIDFTITNTIPFGIMSDRKSDFKMHIHNICIFEDFNPCKCDVHQSTYSTPYGYNDMTTKDNLQDMEVIYSSAAEGIRFQPIELNYIPRTVILEPDILLTNYIDIYSKAEIDKLLEQNMKDKYPPINPDVPDDAQYPGHMFPKPDTHPPADGSYIPYGPDGYYAYYMRTTATNPNALLVVENRIPPESYDVVTMIHQYKVIRDIPDIKIGEYVIFMQGFLDKPRRPRPPYPPYGEGTPEVDPEDQGVIDVPMDDGSNGSTDTGSDDSGVDTGSDPIVDSNGFVEIPM